MSKCPVFVCSLCGGGAPGRALYLQELVSLPRGGWMKIGYLLIIQYSKKFLISKYGTSGALAYSSILHILSKAIVPMFVVLFSINQSIQ